MKFVRSLLRLKRLPRRPEPVPLSWPLVYVPRLITDETARLVASFGTREQPHEGIAYWAGIDTGAVLVVTTVVVPEATTTAGSYQTSIVANATMIRAVNASKLQVLAQVHGHPKDWVGHSEGDNDGAFMPYRGFYSIVLPHYGRRGMVPLGQCGFHRYDGQRFGQLRLDEVESHFFLTETSIDLRSGS